MFVRKITCIYNIYIYTYITNTYHFHHLTASQSTELPLPIPDKPAKVSGFAPWWITSVFPHGCFVTLVWEGWRGDILEFTYQRFIIHLDSSEKSEGVSLEGFGQVSAKKLVYWLYVYIYIHTYNQSSKIGRKNRTFLLLVFLASICIPSSSTKEPMAVANHRISAFPLGEMDIAAGATRMEWILYLGLINPFPWFFTNIWRCPFGGRLQQLIFLGMMVTCQTHFFRLWNVPTIRFAPIAIELRLIFSHGPMKRNVQNKFANSEWST